MTISPSIFKAYDIRGIVGKTIDEQFAEHLGRAFGSEARKLGEKAVAVGRDGRMSGQWLSAALIRGLNDSGVDVVRHVQQQGRGVLLLVLHTTTMDLCAALLRRQLIVDFTYQPAAHPVLEQAQRRGRTRRDIRPGDGSTPQHEAADQAHQHREEDAVEVEDRKVNHPSLLLRLQMRQVVTNVLTSGGTVLHSVFFSSHQLLFDQLLCR